MSYYHLTKSESEVLLLMTEIEICKNIIASRDHIFLILTSEGSMYKSLAMNKDFNTSYFSVNKEY